MNNSISLRVYEINVLVRRLAILTSAIPLPHREYANFEELNSRAGLIDTLSWIDEQERIDREVASSTDNS